METKNRELLEDKLPAIKERVENEAKHGDKSKAAKNAEISVATLNRGLNQDSFDKVSDDQYAGIVELMKILNTRKNKRSELSGYVN